ncbi:hypothetical protein [Haladaptatus sp. NG-WS-4]
MTALFTRVVKNLGGYRTEEASALFTFDGHRRDVEIADRKPG